jgi:ketosteroid isomerase-like protein
MTVVSNLDDFQALAPFFRIIERGVAGLVDGEHFFDLLAEDVVFEYVITVPGYPRRVVGRHAVA